MYYNQINDVPCAYITKNKQRIKQYSEVVYLKDGSEFEIELYNPSRKTVLAKININGEFINGGGIILRPGERVFLERYIDVPNKFKFETYRVDSSTETKNAITNNGEIMVYFHEEEEIVVTTYTSPSWKLYGGSNFTTNTCATPHFTPNSINFASNVGSSMNFEGITGTISFSDNPRTNKYQNLRGFGKKSKSIETGRVEKGSSSDQTFKSISKNFNAWVVSTSTWKILPESQKPVEKKDLIDKCPRCSTKIKKSSWKFCPECGHQMVRTKTEIHYTLKVGVIIDGKQYFMQDYNDTLDNFLKRHENKLIYIKSDSLTSDSLRAIVID